MADFREPQSANEALLQNILGAENEIREPQSVTEYYLKQILEQGGKGQYLLVNYRYAVVSGGRKYVADKTYDEIINAMNNGILVIANLQTEHSSDGQEQTYYTQTTNMQIFPTGQIQFVALGKIKVAASNWVYAYITAYHNTDNSCQSDKAKFADGIITGI